MKTNRGSYYYLQVGVTFYAGMRPVLVEGKVRVPLTYEPRPSTVKPKKQKKKPAYQQARWIMDWRLHKGRKISRGSRASFARLKKAEPPMTTEDALIPNGAFEPFWCETHGEAKKFRIHSKAVAKAEEIAKLLSISVDKVQIQLHEDQ